MKLYELASACYVYAAFTNFDEAYSKFLKNTSPSLDMRNDDHLKALLEWLRAFGCRQFEKESDGGDSKTLKDWYEKDEHLLPSPSKTLLSLPKDELDKAGKIYENLKDKEISRKTVGATCASKILFALRKDVFPLWDGEMRKKLRQSNRITSYRQYLEYVKQEFLELDEDCKKHDIVLSKVPNELSRPWSSLIKLIDEYHWVVLTRDRKPLTASELEKWHCWAQ